MFNGLTESEVRRRQQAGGSNTLPLPRYRFIKLLLRQINTVFNLLLLAAAGITFALGEPIDASLILLFVVLGVSLSIFQEYKSNAAADKLKSYLVRTITVRRNGKDLDVPTHDLVCGDILVLESGDIVPADAIVRHTTNLTVDETTFTGESVTVFKVETDAQIGTAENILLQGVVIVSGMAYAEVTAIGSQTRLAQISKNISTIQNPNEMAKSVDRISKFILRATLITLSFVVIANIYIEGAEADIPHLLIFAIALAISVIPEALPLVMTFSLSHGALRLAKQNVIVKRLSSVQDLGSIELLCTDKTGTLTENHLVYKNNYLIPESPFHPLILARLAANDLNENHPEPFDQATDKALSLDQQNEVTNFCLLEEESFDPQVRSNGAIVKRNDGLVIHIRRGSPEYFIEQGLIDYTQVKSWLTDEEKLGRRVLGVSYDCGEGQRFGGFVSFADTLKASALETIIEAKKLNVALTIITGDSKRVAEAIGREVGIVTDDLEIIETNEFFLLSATEQHKRIGKIRVFARTTPEQKLSLIELLKENYTVGFLGEGINDAPALKAAHVSMVVQSASDVARETADIILLESDLRVIIDGIRLGRETHANILKYIRATLVSNFGNFYAVAIGSLFISFLPMLPKQLLLLNLLSDFPMMAIAFDKVGKHEVEHPQHFDFRSLYIVFITLGLISTAFDFAYFALFYRISPEVLQTNWFIASVITEILLIISIRSMLPIGKAGRPATIIIILSVAALIITIALPLIPMTAQFLHFVPPTLTDLTIIILLAILYVIITEAVKRPLVRFLAKGKA